MIKNTKITKKLNTQVDGGDYYYEIPLGVTKL